MASVINVTTLKKGAEQLGIDIGELKKKKDLEKLIDEHLSQQELEYECPSCSKDIPDLDFCPYCQESFLDDEEDTSDENTEEVTEEAVEEEVEEETTEEEEGNIGTVEEEEDVTSPVVDSTDENIEVTGTPIIAIEVGEVQPEQKKETKKNTESKPRGRKRNTVGKEEQEKQFQELVAKVDEILGDEYTKVINTTGTTYKKEKKRVLKVVFGKTLSIEFNVDVTTDDEGLRTFTVEEAKAKHLGSMKSIYQIGDMETAFELIEQVKQ